MTEHQIARYGWKPDTPDHRDLLFHERSAVLTPSAVPPMWDLAAAMPPIYDQAQLGSCTGNGIARILEYEQHRQEEQTGTPSRLFIYYEERVLEGTVGQDAGAEIRDGIKVVASKGAPPETDWPYDIARFAERPPQQAYDDAVRYEALAYERIVVGTPGAPMRTAISSGLPIVCGFSVPASFEDGSWDPASQSLPVPGPGAQIIGGHCVVISGYDFTRRRFPRPAFQLENSWGPGWGMGGRFWMDAGWFTPSLGLASDLWVITRVR